MIWIEPQPGQLLKATREVMAFYRIYDHAGGELWVSRYPDIPKEEIVMCLGRYEYENYEANGHYYAWKVWFRETVVLVNPVTQRQIDAGGFEGWELWFAGNFEVINGEKENDRQD